MVQITDATRTVVRLNRPPCRVVSLVPSTTETVFEVGGEPQLAAVTRYCIHPAHARRQFPVVGGTKSPRIDLIRNLDPDLVLANQEENREQDVTEIRGFAPVYVSFPRDVPTAIAEIVNLGIILGREDRGRGLAEEISEALANLRQEARHRPRFRYLYLIWRNPYMAAAPETFVDALLGEAGGENVVTPETSRYPEIQSAGIADARPDVVLFSSEPYPFTDRDMKEFLQKTGTESVLEGRTLPVDGELLSWHGARMRLGIPYVSRLADRITAPGRIWG